MRREYRYKQGKNTTHCPCCNGASVVLQTRKGSQRQRECVECKHRFWTFEVTQSEYLNLVDFQRNLIPKLKDFLSRMEELTNGE